MLYKEIEDYIKTHQPKTEDFDKFLDGLQGMVGNLFPTGRVHILTWQIDNDTFRIDRAFDEILRFVKAFNIIAYSVNWDLTHEYLILTIVA